MRGPSNVTRFILIIEFVLVAYMLYALTSSVYRSYQIDQHIAQFERENQEIALENDRLSDDFAYYSSQAYKEKIAKQNFGLVNPGEQVIVIPDQNVVAQPEDELLQKKSARKWERLSNPEKWWNFFLRAG
jgi:cell division protein FtsB